MFVVSFPYAIRHGGLWALLAIIGIAFISCYTGEILVDCLYDDVVSNSNSNSNSSNSRNSKDIRSRGLRKRSSYLQIAQHVWGKSKGAKMVNAAQIIGNHFII